MHERKNIISIVILALLFCGIGVYIYTDVQKKKIETTGVISENTQATTTANSEQGYTITQVPIESYTVNVKAPNLDRPIVFATSISQEEKQNITNNIKRLVNLLKLDSTRFDAWLDLGSYRKQGGDYDGTKEAWGYAAILVPESYIPWNNLGDLYVRYLKNYPKAEESFKKAIALKQDYIEGYSALYELYHLIYTEKANLADDILLEGLSKNPKSTDLMILLAQYYKETGDKDKARTYYQKALTEAKAQGNTSLATLIEQELKALDN